MRCFNYKKEERVNTPVERNLSQRVPDNDPLAAFRKVIGNPDINSVLIVVGHRAVNWGTATYEDEREYEYNKKLAKRIKELIFKARPDMKVAVEFRDVGGLKGAMTRGNSIEPDIVLMLHLNGASRVAFGTENLVLEKDWDSAEIAFGLSSYVADTMGFMVRRSCRHPDHGKLVGVKEVGYITKKKWGVPYKGRDRGTYNLEHARDYTTARIRLLIEPTFVNFKTRESEKIVSAEGREKYAQSIATFMATL